VRIFRLGGGLYCFAKLRILEDIDMREGSPAPAKLFELADIPTAVH
jgi:hypothetical protein